SGSFVNAHYRRSTSSNEFMDHPRGVFLEQRFSGNLVRETETRMAEVFNASLQADLSANVRLTIGGTHSIADNEYRVAQKRNSTTTVDRLSGAVAYKLGSNATVKARLETSETLHDLGSQSLGSYTDKRQSAKLDIAYPVSSTLQVQLGTGAQLFQNFYKAKDVNPRDRDQLDEYVNLRINSTPFPKVAAAVFLSASQTRYVNIDGSLSQNNRRETTYDFRPEFTYKITERLELKQEYGLNIEFTEFDFTEEDNFLDRNFLFGNTVRAKLTPSLSSTFDYSLLLHDRGSYLRPAPGAERLLDIDQEDRRDQMSIGFRYQINPRLALVGRNDYTIRRDQLAGGSGTSSFEEGGLEVGAEGKYDFGGGRRLVFRLMKVSRFGRFSSPEQEDYWNMDSSLNYPF
ncbi:MAG: hypothetical protein OEN01_00900, partial [Candidatus Krumholzibacteria bacterium]|nr:hypothetical protein [Candidatus Krumholzibacteria bacterium]